MGTTILHINNMSDSYLIFQIQEANDLPAAGAFGKKANAFFKLIMPPTETKSLVIKGDSNPKWNQSLSAGFGITKLNVESKLKTLKDKVRIEIWSKKGLLKVVLGQVVIDLEKLFKEGKISATE